MPSPARSRGARVGGFKTKVIKTRGVFGGKTTRSVGYRSDTLKVEIVSQLVGDSNHKKSRYTEAASRILELSTKGDLESRRAMLKILPDQVFVDQLVKGRVTAIKGNVLLKISSPVHFGAKKGKFVSVVEYPHSALDISYETEPRTTRDETPSPALQQLQRAADARAQVATEFGLLSSREVAELADSRARNRAATAHRWEQARRIFSVPGGSGDVYPGFQFDHGQPLAAIHEVIEVLSPRLEGWRLAIWFTAPNGWLDRDRPVDRLVSEPTSVIAAAQQASTELM